MKQNLDKKPIVILGPMESESAWLIDQLDQPKENAVGAYTCLLYTSPSPRDRG